jgi:hypothetical protein
LQATVAAVAERAAAAGEPATATFARIWDAAHRQAGETPPPVPAPGLRPRPPRLTESWFC